MTRPPRRVELALAAMAGAIFCAAPTVGDVGGCGRLATDLDESQFARARKSVDCKRCGTCGFGTHRCGEACGPDAVPYVAFPSTCKPLLHDGEVCLRALEAASCADYLGYVDDVIPSAPTECGFCRFASDAGSK